MLPTNPVDPAEVRLADRVIARPTLLRELVDRARATEAEATPRGAATAPRRERTAPRSRSAGSGATTGLELVARDLDLDEGLSVDVVFRDDDGVPWWVFCDEGGGGALLGRVLCAWRALERLRPLMQQWGSPSMVLEDPVLVLVCPRFLHGARAAARSLNLPGLSCVEWPAVLERARRARSAEAEADRPARSTNGPANGPTKKPRPSPKNGGSDRGATRRNGGEANGRPKPPRESVREEAQRKILRIGEEVCEEIDGDLLRFLVHGRVLAVLAAGSAGLSLYVGDRPERRRQIGDRRDLDAALDDVFRRFCELVTAPAVE